MELNFKENTKYKIVVELKGEDHTFCNLLVKELQKNPDVKNAAYRIDHPLKGIPELLVETNDKTTAKKALLDAVAGIKKMNDKFAADVAKSIK
ncbi:DNA-directed RNA polymerase subunit L [Candidatus Woesearchaeota archaeon]|nr:DNA-directed RNA polymerase subunit L [Candidatus Woesearchaeota archaeon]MBW3017467.1 DNA-directed RNA polymerase subunit L [Candidatus Woesearchaeota archaeon]